ncbi:MAG TPA: NAD(P)-dependent oxidoreductase [Nocardioidaceae bacterium]|nr:NAD(P)-dependent oxidoreductase [Nocardioidaceae bacterium]
MRIFLAGASGALGRVLTPLLVDAGHDVVGTTRTEANLATLERLGAEPALMDGLDAESVAATVSAAAPDVVIHQLTSLKGIGSLKKLDRTFTLTNRLRTTGTDLLLDAARTAGAKRFIAQSFTGWTNPRSGGPVKTEYDGLDPRPAAASKETLAAIRHIEQVVPEAAGLTGIVLRYGGFYGPGTSLGRGGEVLTMVQQRRLPIVGAGTGVWSFIHIEDAARATLQAVDHGEAGVYNVVDDDPAPAADWLPVLAEACGARPPRRLPTWLARPLAGELAVLMMTAARGSSNAKAGRELEWRPRYTSWRQGFVDGLG